MNSVLFKGWLMHHRFQPKVHRFRYRVVSWLFDLDELGQLDGRLKLFSRSRFNLFSFYDSDYGDGSNSALKEQINQLLEEYHLPAADKVQLLCYPRVMGYVFNPLSVYYCFFAGKLMATVYEVSNTFEERHRYVIAAVKGAADNSRTIKNYQTANKQMHVSPFFERDCYYRFDAPEPNTTLKLNIELFRHQQKLFIASLTGKRQPVSDRALLTAFTSIPFQTLKVIFTIHWQALKLFLKGIPVVRHIPLEKNYSSSKGQPYSKKTSTSMEAET